jgi:DNA-binding response OmpR family regulator
MDNNPPPAPGREITKGRLKLDTVAAKAYHSGGDLRLAPKEFAVLHLLIKNQGKAIAAQKLYEEVWKQPMVCGDKPVKNAVYRLRKKLEQGSSDYTVVMHRGDGYCFEKI